MERIRVSINDPNIAHHIQGAVSELEIDEKFTLDDISITSSKRSEHSALVNMACVEKLEERLDYKKTFDPRRNDGSELTPKICKRCYFTQESKSGPKRVNCIIFDAATTVPSATLAK